MGIDHVVCFFLLWLFWLWIVEQYPKQRANVLCHIQYVFCGCWSIHPYRCCCCCCSGGGDDDDDISFDMFVRLNSTGIMQPKYISIWYDRFQLEWAFNCVTTTTTTTTTTKMCDHIFRHCHIHKWREIYQIPLYTHWFTFFFITYSPCFDVLFSRKLKLSQKMK